MTAPPEARGGATGAGAPQPNGGLRSISAITGRGLLYRVRRAAYAVGEVAERAL